MMMGGWVGEWMNKNDEEKKKRGLGFELTGTVQ